MAIVLVLGAVLHVDHELLSEHLSHLTLRVLELTSLDDDLIILSDGHGLHAVLLSESSGKTGTHEHSSHVGRGAEVGLSGLSSARRYIRVGLHH